MPRREGLSQFRYYFAVQSKRFFLFTDVSCKCHDLSLRTELAQILFTDINYSTILRLSIGDDRRQSSQGLGQ